MTDQFIDSLCPGTYYVQVIDQLGCTDTDTVVVNNTNTLTALASVVSPILCNGDSSGVITVNISGGTGPYTFNWSNGDTTQTCSGIWAGCYNVVVTEASGCTQADTICIFQPLPLSLSAFASNTYCTPCNGTAAAIGGGGTTPYTYDWSNAMTGQSISGLCAGTYTVVLTDANGCIRTQSVTVGIDPAFNINVSLITPASCFSCCDGVLGVTPGNGSGPYSYLWSPGSIATAVASGLCTGMYTVCVTEAGGCMICDSIWLPSPVGINDDPQYTLSVFPNPAEGMIKLDHSGLIQYVTITDPAGRKVYHNSAVNMKALTVDLTGLPNGIYNIEVFDGVSVLRQRILLNK